MKRSELKWSAGFYRLIGLDPATDLPDLERYIDLVHPSDRGDLSRASFLSDRFTDERRFRILRPDGSMRWLVCRREAIHAPDGELLFILGVVADVTGQEELRRNVGSLSASVEVLGDLMGFACVWRVGPGGDVKESLGWTRLTGQTEVEYVGWGWLDVVHPKDVDAVRAAWEQAVRDEQMFRANFRVLGACGQYLAVVSMGRALRGPDGRVEGWAGVLVPVEVGTGSTSSEHFTGRQIQAARAMLDWSAQDLARRSGLSLSTVRRLESRGSRIAEGGSARLLATALEREGISFPADSKGGICVRREPGR